MQKIFLLIACLCTFYISHAGKKNPQKVSLQKSIHDSWINSFLQFQDAVNKSDKAKVKQFIDFPIMNENNEIWNLVYDNDNKRISKLPSGPQPFTEADFDTYFNKIFTGRFINTILKINARELYDKGEYKTQEFKDGTITYKMFATFDKESQTLTLNLASQTQDRSEDNGMFSIIYQFDIINGNQVKFRQVRIAG
ncbi:MAG TPA: hypothetical protein VG847_03510 [Chitinophagaceae bacterium]|nr:hypothetical protein [Chitinophagaceae bacterium]